MSDTVNILLVNADPTLLPLWEQLNFSPHTLKKTDSVEQALQLASSFDPGVILIPEQLQNGSGVSLAKQLSQKSPLAVILLLSPAESNLPSEAVLGAGVSHWLRHPWDPQIVQSTLNEAVAKNLQNRAWLRNERRLTTGSLQKQIFELDTILTQILDGVIVISDSGTVLMVNPVAREAFDLGEEELAGKPVQDVFSHQELLKIFRGEFPDQSRIEIQTGERTFFAASRLVIPGVGHMISLHDISYLKELNRMKTDFVNTVSHDLRSPLTSILGYVELIKRAGDINRQQSEFINQVQESVHQITKLISEVLDLSTMENRLDKNFARVALEEITQEVVASMRPLIDQSRLVLTQEIEEQLPRILGDSIQLRQMFENLIGNGIKYTPAGGRITLRAHHEADQIICQVEDTGRGIPLEDQNRIFEPFFRSANVSEETEGTGLGLAITKTVVDNHSGRIWVDSKLGVGSKFTIVLPIIK